MKFSMYNVLMPSNKINTYYLFNTFSGSCFEIDNSTAEIIRNNDIKALSSETKELFSLSGVIIDNEKNEQNAISYTHNLQKFDKSNHISTVFLTWDCNLNCTYCYQGEEKLQESMTKENADKYISFTLKSIVKNSSKNVILFLFGGEPLLNLDIGIYIIDKIKTFCDANELGFSTNLVTNGTLLDKETILKLQKYNFHSVQITLDGIKEVHDQRRMFTNGQGTFDETIKALRILNTMNDIRITIRVNLDKNNIDSTYKLLDYIGENGESLTNCNVFFAVVRTASSACTANVANCLADSEIADLTYDLWNYAETQGFKIHTQPTSRAVHCGSYCENSYSIAPNLDVYKCTVHAGDPTHLMGKIDENSNFVNHTPAFFEWMSVDPLKNASCKACSYLPICGGGCGVSAYNNYGTYQAEGCYQMKSTTDKRVLKFIEYTMNNKL